MSTNALVRTAWQENVFLNINNGAQSYPRLIEPVSQDEITLGRDLTTKKVYFWTYVVTSVMAFPYIGGGVNIREEKFKVEISHVRERATQNNPAADTSFNDVIDAFQTVAGYVRASAMGAKWDGTVDLFTPPTELEIESIEWDGRPCWKGKQVYIASKRITS